MKIYPNKMSVKVKNEINQDTDIQLAYVDTTESDWNINTVYNNDYNAALKKELLPYDVINTTSCLFDKNGNQIDYKNMEKDFSKVENGYMYVPKTDCINFLPKTFEYCIKAKKRESYKSNMLYNINALAFKNKTLGNNLMQIFGDAPSRNLAPNNIIINNGDLSLSSITDGEVNDNDITFFMCKNNKTILDEEGKETSINIDYMLNEYKTNLIFVMKNDNAIKDYEGVEYDETEVNLMFSKVTEKYTASKANIYKNAYLTAKYYFNIPKNTTSKKYSSVFSNKTKSPILIEDNVDKGIIIYITEDILNNIKDNYQIFYEAILYAYFNGYITSDYQSGWIADKIPDYIVEDNKLLKKKKFLSKLTPSELFNLSSDEYYNLKVIIDNEKYPFVKYDGMYNNYLSFSKIIGSNNEYADPVIDKDYISIYSGDTIFFYPSLIYEIDDSIENCTNIVLDSENKKISLYLDSYRNSSNNIYVKNINKCTLEISLIETVNNIEQDIINKNYYLIIKDNESVSYFEVVSETDYSDGIIMATITISKDQSTLKNTLYDMRQRGGGLPENEADNFDCFDIGNINGRPYRKGGTLIISLPKYLEGYKDTVMNIVDQYKLADDYPIIIFNKEE